MVTIRTQVTARARELRKRSVAHIFHTFGVPNIEPELIFEKGKGITLTDADGKEYLDMCSFFHCCSLGYGRKELVDAVYEQMNKLTFTPTFLLCSNIPAIEYAEALAEFAPKSVNHFFFCNGGSEANETAIKIARAYWWVQGKATKLKIICLNDAYHGATIFVQGLMGDPENGIPFGPAAPGIIRLPNYNCYRCQLGLKYPDCGIDCAKTIEKVIEEEGEDTVAAFIAEPVQGVGGGVAPPPEYFPMVREICSRRNVLWIDDEVMTGFCRTGKNFCVDHWNVEPDLMCMAKGINSAHFPMGAVGVGDKVYTALASQPLICGFTNGGQPTACASAKAALDIYIKEKICEHVTKVGNHVRERFEKEFLRLPHVGNIGGLGLMQSIEIVADKETKRRFPAVTNLRSLLLERCLERGLIPRIYSERRHDRLAFAPPLVITEEEADRELDIVYSVISGLKDLKTK